MILEENKNLQEKIKALILEGKTNNEICDMLNVNHNHVSYVAKKYNLTGLRTKGRRKKYKEEQYTNVKKDKKWVKGNNPKRKMCKSCIYRKPTKDLFGANCRYILIEGHSRGCPAYDCNKYVKGKPKRMPINKF